MHTAEEDERARKWEANWRQTNIYKDKKYRFLIEKGLTVSEVAALCNVSIERVQTAIDYSYEWLREVHVGGDLSKTIAWYGLPSKPTE